jgi:hypothetical protein
MLTVHKANEQPPGGWRLTVEATGLTLQAPYPSTLRRKVRDHLLANDLPLPDNFDAWADDAMCHESNHDGFCGPPVPTVREWSAWVDFQKVVRFLKTMLAWAKKGEFVSQEESERRAAICNQCPMAVPINGGCRPCSAVFKEIKKLIKDRPDTLERGREACEACGCFLRLKLLVPSDVLDKAEKGNTPDYAPGCWRLTPDP